MVSAKKEVINCSPSVINNVNLAAYEKSTTATTTDEVLNPYGTETAKTTATTTTIDNELIVLKSFITILQDNNILKDKKITLPAEKLCNFIMEATGADDVKISVNNDVGCLHSCNHKIENILIMKDNNRQDFKINYNQLYLYIKELGINLKYCLI